MTGNEKMTEQIQGAILKAAEPEVAAAVERLEGLRAKIKAIEGKAAARQETATGLKAKLAEIKERAAKVLSGGKDPLPSLKEAREIQADLEALAELPDLEEEILEDLKGQVAEVKAEIQTGLGKAVGQIRADYDGRFTALLEEAAELDQAWTAASKVSVAGVSVNFPSQFAHSLKCREKNVERHIKNVLGF